MQRWYLTTENPSKRTHRRAAQAMAAMIAWAASLGEPWLSFFSPHELASALSAIGFSRVEDLTPRDIAIRYFRKQIRHRIRQAHAWCSLARAEVVRS